MEELHALKAVEPSEKAFDVVTLVADLTGYFSPGVPGILTV
jgi:hypothetical protein